MNRGNKMFILICVCIVLKYKCTCHKSMLMNFNLDDNGISVTDIPLPLYSIMFLYTQGIVGKVTYIVTFEFIAWKSVGLLKNISFWNIKINMSLWYFIYVNISKDLWCNCPQPWLVYGTGHTQVSKQLSSQSLKLRGNTVFFVAAQKFVHNFCLLHVEVMLIELLSSLLLIVSFSFSFSF